MDRSVPVHDLQGDVCVARQRSGEQQLDHATYLDEREFVRHAGLPKWLPEVGNAEQLARVQRLEFSFDPEFLCVVGRERGRTDAKEIVGRKVVV